MADAAERAYSVEEANALLDDLRERILRLRDARRVMVAGAERIRAGSQANGGGTVGTEYLEASATVRHEVERLAEERIILRDAESGLVDFPSRREGRIIHLCWKVEEERVAHWHEPNAGFANRRPL